MQRNVMVEGGNVFVFVLVLPFLIYIGKGILLDQIMRSISYNTKLFLLASMGLESGVATRLLQGNPKNRILLGLALVFFGYFGRHLQFLLVIHKTNC